MRFNRHRYEDMSRSSIQRDFQRPQYLENCKPASNDKEKRVLCVGENSQYYRLRRYVEGRLVRIVSFSEYGWECEFVYDKDRKALNAAAGWDDRKKTYILDFTKFSE